MSISCGNHPALHNYQELLAAKSLLIAILWSMAHKTVVLSCLDSSCWALANWVSKLEMFLRISAFQLLCTLFYLCWYSYQQQTCHNTFFFSVYNSLIETDSNSEVRRAVLSCISPSVKTLPKIIGRTMDVKETVRKLAYQVNKYLVMSLAIYSALKLNKLLENLAGRRTSIHVWITLCKKIL